ncbi:hypothetical protein, partial [Bradyrhizobium genomosp. III]|uniref:hypothetical protein n=1 Tax=Bradyrhizobium genomosp. III TaxID=2683271 RepID=UPI001AEBECA6
MRALVRILVFIMPRFKRRTGGCGEISRILHMHHGCSIVKLNRLPACDQPIDFVRSLPRCGEAASGCWNLRIHNFQLLGRWSALPPRTSVRGCSVVEFCIPKVRPRGGFGGGR